VHKSVVSENKGLNDEQIKAKSIVHNIFFLEVEDNRLKEQFVLMKLKLFEIVS
jgi:hypothetical protein